MKRLYTKYIVLLVCFIALLLPATAYSQEAIKGTVTIPQYQNDTILFRSMLLSTVYHQENMPQAGFYRQLEKAY